MGARSHLNGIYLMWNLALSGFVALLGNSFVLGAIAFAVLSVIRLSSGDIRMAPRQRRP